MTQKLVVSAIKILTAVFMLCNTSGIAQTASKQKPTRPILITNQIEVQFETDVNVDKIGNKSSALRPGIPTLQLVLDKHQIKQAKKMFPWRKGKDAVAGTDDMSKFLIVSLPEGSDVYSIIDDLKKSPYVRSVSPIWGMPIYEVVPNDPKFGGQWGLIKIGAKDVWEIEKGSETAIVAVVDVGVLYTHVDLKDNIWVNPGEDIDGDGVVFDLGDVNDVDDDGNGLKDDLIGYDFFTGVTNSDPWPGEDVSFPDIDPKDFNGHGTHIAGIASAVANNGLYGVGLAGGWGGGIGPNRGPRIMCIRVGGSYKHPDDPTQETGYVNTANCAQGVDYAARMGACVVNCSWGFFNSSSAMAAAGLLCNQNDVMVLHAAGNEGEYSLAGGYLDDLFLGSPPMEVALSVAATDYPGLYRSSFSNYGEYIDICAPGKGIYSIYSYHYGPTDAWISGTSMATPFVTGLVALIKSHMPHYTKPEITALILDNAVNIDALNPGYEGFLGAGLMDAYASMANLPTAAFEAGPKLVGPAPLEVNFTDLSPNNPSSWSWDFGDGGSSVIQNPTYIYDDFGLHSVSLTVNEPRGTTTELLKNLVMVTADTIKFDSIRIPKSSRYKIVTLPIYIRNQFINKGMYIPFRVRMNGEIVGNQYISLVSVSAEGTLSEYFENISIVPYSHISNRYGISLLTNTGGGSEYLQPGAGILVNLDFEIASSVPDGTIFSMDTLTLNGPLRQVSLYGAYCPVFVGGKIFVKDEICGDLNKDLEVNVIDIVYLISYKFKDGPPPEPVMAGDVNSDGEIDINDVIDFINYKYRDGPELCNP